MSIKVTLVRGAHGAQASKLWHIGVVDCKRTSNALKRRLLLFGSRLSNCNLAPKSFCLPGTFKVLKYPKP